MVRKAQDEAICAAIERMGERMRAMATETEGMPRCPHCLCVEGHLADCILATPPMRASAAMERGKAAGWERTANGRVLLGVLAKRAAGLTRQMTTEEIMAQYRANKGA